jgi:methyl halide transferase
LKKLDDAYWNGRYLEENTPWDLGEVSPALKSFIDSLTAKDQRVLIPGAGRGYEPIYMHRAGFTHIVVCDWSEAALKHLSEIEPSFPKDNLVCADFFELTGTFDLLLEQTFFCAIDPARRRDYVQKASELLRPGGTLAGLLFAQEFPLEGPPFGGTKQEYEALFSPGFHVGQLDLAENSVKPRAGNEVFVRFIRRS